jgi:3-phenylpropionate/trans-cinnamate dioxygenase ferredoxin reductase component
MTPLVLIAGAGLAGSRVAESLRAFGFEGRIVLAGEEPHAPYERPALSKEFLAGARDDVALRPDAFWADRGIELLTGRRVDDVDPARRVARVGNDVVAWNALVLATGAQARALPGPPGVHTLRTLDDARQLASAVDETTRVVVVGAGFIGAEVASTLLPKVASVTIVEPLPAPLVRVLGAEVGALLARTYRACGAVLHLGTGVARFHGDDRVRAVELDDGTLVPADVVVVGIGATPSSPFGGAIDVDEHGRSEIESVYACGDVAAWWRPSLGRRLRVEHWTAAAGQARAVAATITGTPVAYDDAPYFWSDQFGLRLQHVGHADEWQSVLVDGNEHSFTARYLDADGRVLAGLAVNRPHALPTLRNELAATVSAGHPVGVGKTRSGSR